MIKSRLDENRINFKKYNSDIISITSRLKTLNANTEKIISNEYRVTLSMFVPDEKTRKTIKMLAYTNSDDTKFISADFK